MKVLNIEQKAKHYDEALEKAKAWCDCEHATTDDKILLKRILPELKENEDKRIRKEIVSAINIYCSEYHRGTKVRNDMLDWIEKQGEQKNKIQPKFNIGDTIRFKGNETLKGETESHKIVGYDNELYIFADGTTDLFCEQDLYELVEQKPIENVEPKFSYGDRVRNKKSGVTQILGSCIEDVYEGAFPFRIKEQDDWELVEQKPAWSEEDEHKLKDIIYFLDTAKKHYASTVELDACIDWLKSIRPQNTWKPSDEQINAFDAVLAYNPPCSNECRNHLITLYNDLKKLKS